MGFQPGRASRNNGDRRSIGRQVIRSFPGEARCLGQDHNEWHTPSGVDHTGRRRSMERWIGASALRQAARLAAAVMAILLMSGIGPRVAGADTFAPQNDDWKGTKLDLTKWHFTVWGDAQLSEHSAEI